MGGCQKGGRGERLAGATTEHGGSDAGHGRLGLDMQVSVHLIGAPAPDEPDAIAVHTRAKEGHGAARPHGACGEHGGRKTEGRRRRGGCKAKEGGDGSGQDIGPTPPMKVCVEGGVGGGSVVAEMCDAG
jgi:hypothetical protein